MLVAAPRTQEQLHAAGKVVDPRCPYCDLEEDEDLPHLYWRCPRWAPQRKEGMGQEIVDCTDWPAVTQHTGLLPEPEEEWEAEGARTKEEALPRHPGQLPPGEDFTLLDNMVVCSTDGSCEFPTYPHRFRLAG